MFGKVNNVTFTRENVLLKTQPQIINGNVFISNKDFNDNRIFTLSFEQVLVESINGKLISEFHQSIVYKEDPMVQIGTRLEFHELLTVDHMQFYENFNEYNLNDLINEVQLYQVATNYSEHFNQMSVLGQGIVDEMKSEFFWVSTKHLRFFYQ